MPAGRPVNAGRLPHHVLASVFQYLKLKDLSSCMRVCKHWSGYLANENCGIWRYFCRKILPEMALADPYLLCELSTYKSKLRAFYHAWNPTDCSRNAYIKTNCFTMHRHPIAQSTDGVRSKVGLNVGRHAWEVWWEGPLGTVAVVGVATRHAALQCPGYLPLLGSDDQGIIHRLRDTCSQAGEKIRVILDCDDHLMYFEKGYEFLGVAFKNLPPVRLYPCVCAVYGNTEVSMVYLGPPLDG